MFVVIYQFNVRAENEADFLRGWHGLTEQIRLHRNSLGSRLHREENGVFIAYAQWPSREQFELKIQMPALAEQYRELMAKNCLSSKILHQLEVVDDLLAIQSGPKT